MAVLEDLGHDRKMLWLKRINSLLFAPFSFVVGFGAESDLVKQLGHDPVVIGGLGDGEIEIRFDVLSIGAGQVGDFLAVLVRPRLGQAEEFRES